MLGQALAYAPDVNGAIISAFRIKSLIERVPKMKNVSTLPKKSHVVRFLFLFKFFQF